MRFGAKSDADKAPLESLFNLNPGENISIDNVVDLMEAELDNGGLNVFQSIFKFE